MTTPPTIKQKNKNDFEDDSVYLITFSPSSDSKNPSYSYMDHYSRFFFSWDKCMKDYELNMELQPGTGRAHWHGYFILKDKVKWYKAVLPRLKYNGFVKINKVTDNLDKAMEYCRKDRKLMELIIKNYVPLKFKSELPILEDYDEDGKNILDYMIDDEIKDLHKLLKQHDRKMFLTTI